MNQTSHAFAFGNIGFDLIGHANGEADESQLAADWLELFNTATLPFYWSDFEPRQGQPATARLRAAAEWFVERGVSVKGHPLVWHTLAPAWLGGLEASAIEELTRARIRREVTGFAGLIDTWDAINEVVIMPVFDKDDNAITRLARAVGGIPMIRMAFEQARAANPSATLFLNDFDLSSAYECLNEGALEAGIEIDAIGLQTRMHQGYWGEQKMLAMVDRFARNALHALIKREWWLSPTPMRTDAAGELTVTGLFGDYEIARGTDAAPFTIARDEPRATSALS